MKLKKIAITNYRQFQNAVINFDDELMECVLCHKKELSKTRCEQGHYVCNECHTKGMDAIIEICLSEKSKNPVEIIKRMMA